MLTEHAPTLEPRVSLISYFFKGNTFLSNEGKFFGRMYAQNSINDNARKNPRDEL